MLKHLFSKILAVCSLLSITSLSLSAQQLDLNEPMPVDSAVTKGTLSNGLTYYIRPNSKPEQKVELRLVVNAGSILENDNQQGLAHFMEHMNFNGLKHFPKNDLVNYLQKIGVTFGADLNANTGWDRTLFILPIPTDNPENVVKGFEILSDWAGGALVSTDEVNAERPVISEELRMREKNAGTRMMEKFFPEMLNGSRYAYRLPGGKDSIVMNANPDLIRQYYHDWYRPNLMAVVVVGDITVPKAKSMIEKYFGSLKNPQPEKERKYYDIKPYTSPNAMVVTDPETTNYNFSLLFPSQKRPIEKTIGDYRELLLRNIFTQTLNRKLHNLAQVAKPAYSSASASVSGTFGGVTLHNEGFELDVTPIGDFKNAIDSAVAEILRVKEYGFSEEDIENTKKQFLAYYKSAYNEREKTPSSSYVNEYVNNFMEQEPIPGIVNEYKYANELLPGITAREVSNLAGQILSESTNFFALITGPSDGDLPLPSKEELLKMVQEAFQQKVSAPKAAVGVTSLLTREPTSGKIISEKKDKDLGTTTYTLSNGIKVTVKPTDFKSDQINFSGVKYGGTNLYSVADKANAQFLTTIINTMGYGQFTPSELNNFMSGKNANVGTGISETSNNVSGSSSVEDFESLLQLNYLKLTEPRKDTNLFRGFMTKMENQLKFIMSNPQAAFSDTLFKALYDNSPLAPIQIPSQKDLASLNVDKILDIYKDQFGNADGFHFFLVGNVDEVDDLKPLIEKYIGGLPVKGTKPVYKDNGLRMVYGDKTLKFYKGEDQKSLILQIFHNDKIKYSPQLALKASMLGEMMTMEITDTIREKMSVIYSGGANGSVSKRPYAHSNFSIQLPAGPENVDRILPEIEKEISGFKTNGGPEGYLEKVKKAKLENHKDNMKQNGYWLAQLQGILFWGNSKDFFLNYDKEVNEINRKDIIQTANELLGENRFTAISYPETEK